MHSDASRLLSTVVDNKTLVVVSVGSNDKPHGHFKNALDLLSVASEPLTIASVYQSQAVTEKSAMGDEESVFFLNSVVAFWSDKSLVELQQLFKSIEHKCGRNRESNKVSMDIDLLLYGDCQQEIVGGVLPHADILLYAHVLRPLAEILPDVCHPGSTQTYAELWRVFDKKTLLKPVDFIWREQVISSAPACLII